MLDRAYAYSVTPGKFAGKLSKSAKVSREGPAVLLGSMSSPFAPLPTPSSNARPPRTPQVALHTCTQTY